MKQNKVNLFIPAILIFIVVLAGAIIRVIQYPDNFTPIFAMSVFGGAIVKDKKFAFVLPILAMFISDLMFQLSGKALGFWGWGQLLSYGLIALTTIISFRLRKANPGNVIAYSFLAPTVFFILSNLFFFLIDNKVYHTYPQNFEGLQQCYIAGLYFYKVNVLSTIIYSAVLFGSYHVITNYMTRNKQVAA